MWLDIQLKQMQFNRPLNILLTDKHLFFNASNIFKLSELIHFEEDMFTTCFKTCVYRKWDFYRTFKGLSLVVKICQQTFG